MLSIKNLTVSYGENKILNDLSLDIHPNEILMLVGANGAGKTTLLKALFGLIPINHGSIVLDNEAIQPEPHRMAKLGISLVPQTDRIFPEMTVEENIKIGTYILDDKKLIIKRLDEMYNLFPALSKKNRLLASYLSGGERQMMALARSLMLKPKLLLLDEPSVGLAPKIITEIFKNISQIREAFKTTIVIVEHNLKSLLKIADRAVIMVNGRIAKTGLPQELLHSKMLEEIFFGRIA